MGPAITVFLPSGAPEMRELEPAFAKTSKERAARGFERLEKTPRD
jgi:hypothetical protein